MESSSRVDAPGPIDRPGRSGFLRRGAAALGVLGLILSFGGAAAAQTPQPRPTSWEFRVASGAFVPLGDLRHDLEDGRVTAAQLSWVLRPHLALTGTFAWGRSRALGSTEPPRLDVFTSDVGLEARSPEWLADGPVGIRAFAGLGAGVRSYNHRKLDVDATHNRAAYGSLGGELGVRRVALRVEMRGHATGFAPLVGTGPAPVRSDMSFLAALRFNRHPTIRSAQ